MVLQQLIIAEDQQPVGNVITKSVTSAGHHIVLSIMMEVTG